MEISPQIGGLIAIALGLGSGIYLLWSLIRHNASKHWPTAIGEILESHIAEDSDGWVPRVRYRYAVEGKHYQNHRLYFHHSNSSSKERDAMQHLSPYPIGKKVSVYYNPRKPENAVLDRRMPIWLPLFFFFFAIFNLACGVAMWRD